MEGIDLPPGDVEHPVEFMHVCYPAEGDDFVEVTVQYVGRYQPEVVVVTSTVPVGTTRQIGDIASVPVVNSPVRGKHAVMASELLRYTKFIGGDDRSVVRRVAAHFQDAGMRTKAVANPETTELAKLTETTYFGLLIAFAQDVDRMVREVGVDYDEVVSFYEEIEYLPRVTFFPGIIGGHCVMPNITLLKRRFSSQLLDGIEWSNEVRKTDGARS
jgi:UDP-N-acetyl-D-mannosaminuronate dehydrogenase